MLFYHQGTNRLMINSHMKNFARPKGKKPQKEFREMTKSVFFFFCPLNERENSLKYQASLPPSLTSGGRVG